MMKAHFQQIEPHPGETSEVLDKIISYYIVLFTFAKQCTIYKFIFANYIGAVNWKSLKQKLL